ncbi:unnamed protein product [Macrosiphum euphorbiae]|uniref:BZIP domain-containing protein n=1 Tax=Macrosiphum euphorbiae TaxID=13131 RepID=A0AAV0Y2M2_9HEMI|nr:unnamed protein product [Macrosiphum euphorbiae]
MPRERRANIGRRTRHASQQQVYSRNLREERQNIIRENDRLRHRVSTRRSLASYNRLAVELSKLKFKIKRLRSEMNSLYHIARCYHEFSKHMQTLRVVIRPNQSNICASTSQKAATWLCLVLRRKM